jgi:hypothetical protein
MRKDGSALPAEPSCPWTADSSDLREDKRSLICASGAGRSEARDSSRAPSYSSDGSKAAALLSECHLHHAVMPRAVGAMCRKPRATEGCEVDLVMSLGPSKLFTGIDDLRRSQMHSMSMRFDISPGCARQVIRTSLIRFCQDSPIGSRFSTTRTFRSPVPGEASLVIGSLQCRKPLRQHATYGRNHER